MTTSCRALSTRHPGRCPGADRDTLSPAFGASDLEGGRAECQQVAVGPSVNRWRSGRVSTGRRSGRVSTGGGRAGGTCVCMGACVMSNGFDGNTVPRDTDTNVCACTCDETRFQWEMVPGVTDAM